MVDLKELMLWDDYSGLEQLHVYDNLLTLYSLPVHGTISETASLFRRIRALDHRILTVYVSYILGRAGFYSINHSYNMNLNTTEFQDNDWLRNLTLFEIAEEGYRDEWQMDYENENGKTIRILFATTLRTEVRTRLLKVLDESAESYIVVHPRYSRKLNQKFIEAQKAIKGEKNADIVLSTGEFTSRIIPEKAKRDLVEANWVILREKILGVLQKEYPILVYSIHNVQLSDISTRLRKARLKFEIGADLEDAIKDAAVSCEGLLQILHSIFPRKIAEKMEFYELLSDLRNVIVKEFGEDIWNDLDLIRKWRNNVLHAPVTKPDAFIASKIVAKAELFNELFHKKIKRLGIK